MDPLAKKEEAKWSMDGSRTPYFGYWTFVAWDNDLAPVLGKAFGLSMRVMDEENLDDLLCVTVMM